MHIQSNLMNLYQLHVEKMTVLVSSLQEQFWHFGFKMSPIRYSFFPVNPGSTVPAAV